MSGDSPPPDALTSGPMPVEFAMLPSRDDGSPLPIFYMSPKGGTARLRLVSGLTKDIEDRELAAERARELIRNARRLSLKDRRASMPAFNKGIIAARDRWGVFAPDETAPPMLDALRIQWLRASSPPFLVISGYARAENGARMSAWTDRHEMTPADDTRRRLWNDYHLNLGALRAFLELTTPFGNKLTKSASWASLVRHDHFCAYNAGEIITGDVGYYEYEAVELLKDRVVKDHRRLFPWHKGQHGEEMSIGLRFSPPGQPETAQVLLFEGYEPKPIQEAPLVADSAALKTRRATAFRLLSEISETRSKLLEHALEFHNVSGTDKAAASRLNKRIAEGEAVILRKQEEFAKTYAEIIDYIAPKREILLANTRIVAQAGATTAQQRARVEAIKDSYTPVSKLAASLAEHLTVVPVSFTVQTLNPRGDKARVVQAVVGNDGKEIYSRTLDLFEQERAVPEGLPSLADAASRVFGSDLVWLPLLSYVALSMDIRTRSDNPGVQYMNAGDLFRRIRPNAATKIAKNGLADWWRTTHGNLDMTPTDALEASLRFLSGVVIPYKHADVDKRLLGLLSMTSVSKNSRGQVSYGYAWNPELRDLISGNADEGRPQSYMLTNHRALFSYGGRALATAPALQVLLESMASAASIGGGKKVETEAGALEIGLTPGGDHMRFGHLVEKLHLHGERPNHIAKRVEATLGVLQEAGVVEKYSIVGASQNLFERKIRICMSSDYLVLTRLAKAEQEEQRLRKGLETQPFEPLESWGQKKKSWGARPSPKKKP